MTAFIQIHMSAADGGSFQGHRHGGMRSHRCMLTTYFNSVPVKSLSIRRPFGNNFSKFRPGPDSAWLFDQLGDEIPAGVVTLRRVFAPTAYSV